MRKLFSSVLEVVEVLAIAVLAVFAIRTFLVQPFLVSGESMDPTFKNGDYLLVDELTYHIRQPERGEVVVFRYPKDESTFFIKRIIGLPGDTVKIENGNVVIYNQAHPNGETLDEKYLPTGTMTTIRPLETPTYIVGTGQYLVLGDNRQFSYDSRDWGLVSTKEVVGVVRLRLWPVAQATVFSAPIYSQ